MNPAAQLTQDLIRIPSITPRDEGCMDIIIPRLQNLGFSIEKFPCGEAINIWARLGTAKPLLCFVGHTDVVGIGDRRKWTHPPFEGLIENGYMHGRGTADMKSGVAAMIVAIEELIQRQEKLEGSLALLISSAEEGNSSLGTPNVIQALEKRGEKIDLCIVGEASSTHRIGDVIKNGRRGILGGSVTVLGKQGHIAYPHLADNPIHRILAPLSELTKIQWDQGNEYFQPTSFQISNLNAGIGQTNVTPATASCQFNFRYSPEVSHAQLQERTERVLKEHGLKYEIQWEHTGCPFFTQESPFTRACERAVKEVTGVTPELTTGGGTSDGRFVAPTGAEVIEFGVINKTIHQVDECVRLADIETLKDAYVRMIHYSLPGC